MKRQIATIRVACLLPGLLLSGAWAQEGASPAKLDWSRKPIAVRVVRLADIGLPRLTGRYGFFSASGRLPTLPGSGFIRLGYLPYPRPLAVTPLTTDNWLGGSGTWNTTGDWSGGTPTSSSAVTIGNTSSGAVTVSQAGAASAANVSLLSGNTLNIAAANTLTVGGATTLAAGAVLGVGNGGSGGATLTSGGSLTNAGTMQIGSQYNSTASTVTVTGTYTGTGGTLQLYGGNASGSNALLNISGAAAGTLTGTYQIQSGTGSAAVEWGSGGITSIGDGVSNTGYLSLVGSTAYTEIGATNSDSALKTLATIASNGQLYLDNGASMTTIVALTNNGLLGVGNSDNGGSTLTIGGAASTWRTPAPST